jgi:hexulose-6-phosphate isomerase
MNRRAFLHWAGSVCAVVALPSLHAGGQPAEGRPLNTAIMLGTVGGSASVSEKFRMIRAAGFAGVEPMSGMDRSEVLDALKETGLLAPSVCCSTHWSKPLSDPDPEVRRAGLEGLNTALRDAHEYGAKSVLLVPAVVNENVSYADAYERAQAEVRKSLPLAQELGVKIAFENVWNNFLLSPLEAARFVDEFDSPWVGWFFDIGNICSMGWPEQWIRVLGERIVQVHFKEFSRKKMNEQGTWKGFAVEYGEGDVNWPEVMKALQDVGYDGWFIAEPAWRPEGVEVATRLRQVRGKMDELLVP